MNTDNAENMMFAALIVWFVVHAARSWFPSRMIDFLNVEPRRMWVLVFIAAAAASYLLVSADNVREFFISTFAITFSALGADNIRKISSENHEETTLESYLEETRE